MERAYESRAHLADPAGRATAAATSSDLIPAQADRSSQPRLRGLDRKRVLVTGGATGIGAATAERFSQEGAQVLIADRDVSTIRPTPSVRAIQADVTDPEAMNSVVVDAGLDEGLDVCVANAGILLVEDFLDGQASDWRRVLEVNTVGVMITLQAAARQMVSAGRGGRLLATASVAGLRGEQRTTAYCASKAAVIAIVQSLAVELASASITVNAIAPGEIDTQMSADAMSQLSDTTSLTASEFRDQMVSTNIPLGRMGDPRDVAALFAFLASDDASYLTGEVLRVDGGQLLL